MPAALALSVPTVELAARDHRDGRADGSGRAGTDGEVQRFDVGGELLLERERHGLREPRAAAHRKFGFGQRDLAARHEQHDAATLRRAQCVGHGTALDGARAGTVRIHDEPRRRRLLGGTEPNHQRLRHRTSRRYSLPKLRSTGRTEPAPPRASRLYRVNWVVPIVTHTVARK